MFAKLYGTENDQLLVTIDEGENGPEIRFHFKPEGLGVCSFAMQFEDSDAGWDNAEAGFRDMTEERARKLIEPQLKTISELCM